MCNKIETPFVLIHSLKKKKSCTISDLVQKKRSIEQQIEGIYIDISKDSILNFITCFPEIFEFRDKQIFKKEKSHVFFEEPTIEYFGLNIEHSIKLKLTALLEK